MFAATTADAATIVQFDSEGIQSGFNTFDTKLGRLDSAMLTVTSGKSRGWQMIIPFSDATQKTVSYVTKGFMNVRVNSTYVPFAVEGHGDVNVSLSPFNGSSYGYFATSQGGEITFDIGLEAATRPYRVYVDVSDPGYYGDKSEETTFNTSSAGVAIRHISGYCGGNQYGFEDSCGSSSFKLVYNYTPAALLSGVPEPSTWLMMILGFGAVGFALRRRGVLDLA